MSIETDLKKDGIEVTSELDTLKVNSIAKNIAQKLVKNFPEMKFNLGELFIRLSRIHMYTAKVQKGLSEANYFYKNTSIYFNENIDFNKVDNFAMHECIHYLQERKDKKGYLMRLGLCDLTQFKVYGLGINEAAVQLATAKATEVAKEEVKYYGIDFETNSPSCYPLECNLINQMAYITGENVLFDSVFNSNDNFKNTFIELTSEKAFYDIQNNFDKILYAEEDLIKLSNKLEITDENSSNIKNINLKISKLKDFIAITFLQTQDLIISSYFDTAFSRISTLEEVENYRRKLYNYRNLIGVTDTYTFFNNYYIDMMSRLENKYNLLESGQEIENSSTYITVVKHNKIFELFRAIKNFLFKSGDEYKKVDD